MLDANGRDDVDHSVDALEQMYDEAVCVGGALSLWSTQEERLHSPLELVAEITMHTPYLAFVVAQCVGAGETAAERLTCQARRCGALAIRIAHRALEIHARDMGYELEAWRQRAVLEASVALCAAEMDGDGQSNVAAAGVALASRALAAAIVAIPTDRVAVPGHLASAMGGWLAAYAWVKRTHARSGAATD